MENEKTFLNRWIFREVQGVPMLALIAAFCYLAPILFLAARLGGVSDSMTQWGQFGDYLGGLINPLFGLVTITLLVFTLKQNEEAKRALEKQLELAKNEKHFNTALALHQKYEAQIASYPEDDDYDTPVEAKLIDLQRRFKFLSRYIDNSFYEILEFARTNGFDPSKDFAIANIKIGRYSYELVAMEEDRFVRITGCPTAIHGDEVFYWNDYATHHGTPMRYDHKMKYLHDQAEAALRKFHQLSDEERLINYGNIPGLSKVSKIFTNIPSNN